MFEEACLALSKPGPKHLSKRDRKLARQVAAAPNDIPQHYHQVQALMAGSPAAYAAEIQAAIERRRTIQSIGAWPMVSAKKVCLVR